MYKRLKHEAHRRVMDGELEAYNTMIVG